MSQYNFVEAKNWLSELIDRALKGEGVVITRHGRPAARRK
jgi:prevent-host-death family protein